MAGDSDVVVTATRISNDAGGWLVVYGVDHGPPGVSLVAPRQLSEDGGGDATPLLQVSIGIK